MHTKIKKDSTQVPGHPVPPEDKQNPSPSHIPARAHSSKTLFKIFYASGFSALKRKKYQEKEVALKE